MDLVVCSFCFCPQVRWQLTELPWLWEMSVFEFSNSQLAWMKNYSKHCLSVPASTSLQHGCNMKAKHQASSKRSIGFIEQWFVSQIGKACGYIYIVCLWLQWEHLTLCSHVLGPSQCAKISVLVRCREVPDVQLLACTGVFCFVFAVAPFGELFQLLTIAVSIIHVWEQDLFSSILEGIRTILFFVKHWEDGQLFLCMFHEENSHKLSKSEDSFRAKKEYIRLSDDQQTSLDESTKKIKWRWGP